MALHTEDDRDVLAGLSFYTGRPLPAPLFSIACHLGVIPKRWVFPGAAGAAHEHDSVQGLHRLGRSLRERGAASNVSMLVRGDLGWPAGTGFDDLPCLWVRGTLDIAGLLGTSMAVTGTRSSTAAGAFTASGMGGQLAAAGWTVVTGIGYGIDKEAAAGALAADGPGPVLLAASGLDQSRVQHLATTVERAAQRGAVISAFPPDCDPLRRRFQLRQHLLGTVAAATVLVEATKQSHALDTVRASADTGRPVFAVPGPVSTFTSGGCHQLIADGTARLVTSGEDVLAAVTGGSIAQAGLFAVRATVVSRAGDLPWVRQVPLFHVPALSHAHAANAAIDVLVSDCDGAVDLHAGIHDASGTYDAISLSLPA